MFIRPRPWGAAGATAARPATERAPARGLTRAPDRAATEARAEAIGAGSACGWVVRRTRRGSDLVGWERDAWGVRAGVPDARGRGRRRGGE